VQDVRCICGKKIAERQDNGLIEIAISWKGFRIVFQEALVRCWHCGVNVKINRSGTVAAD